MPPDKADKADEKPNRKHFRDVEVVYATSTLCVMDVPAGMVPTFLRSGQPYSADDPVVQYRPELFRDSLVPRSRPAEVAGGAPGLRRGTRAPR